MKIKINLHKEEQDSIKKLVESVGFEETDGLFKGFDYEHVACNATMKDLGDVVSIDLDVNEDFACDTIELVTPMVKDYLGIIKLFTAKVIDYVKKWMVN